MKDLSFFVFKNSVAAKMRKGFTGSCSGNGSTSILDHRKSDAGKPCLSTHSPVNSPYLFNTSSGENHPTLEEMILQLELEEKMARNARVDGFARRRMSCVSNTDILRSARNALNQYPRFSLDGKDAMYRSTFRNRERDSVCFCNGGIRKGFDEECLNMNPGLPPILGGESVVWCKPGVVAKLMGLEAVPVPVRGYHGRGKLSSVIKKQYMRKRAERHEMGRRRLAREGVMSSCSTAENEGVGRPIQHFL